MHPFQRCLRCNALLQSVAEEEIRDRLPERVRDLYHDFTLCSACGKIYWQGTHVQRMKEFTERLFGR
jgi:hypothetical protein